MDARDFDRRTTPARSDLAAAHLRGMVDAPAFAEGVTHQVAAASAELREAPSRASRLETQLLRGERFTVYESADGWAWGQAEADDYVGYMPHALLTTALYTPTHRIRAPQTLIFPAADIKSAPHAPLPFNARIAVEEIEGRLARMAGGGFVFAGHLAPLGEPEPDWIDAALRFLGAPYLWGGKTREGVDCSGLVQTALQSAGIAAPRDSDMQERALGRAIVSTNLDALQRGDLVFWEGHVGAMLDAAHLLHANAFHMAVAVEPLRDAAARSAAPITSIKRL